MIFAQKFFEFERVNGLFEERIKNIKYWHLIRYDLYLEISHKEGYFEVAHPKDVRKNSYAGYILNFLNMLGDHIKYGSYRRLMPGGVLLLRNHDAIVYDGEKVDRFYGTFQGKLKTHCNYIEVGLNTRSNRFPTDKNTACNSELYLLKYLQILCGARKITKDILITAKALTDKINRHFSCNVDYHYILNLIAKSINNYTIYYNYYRKIFIRLQPKLVVIVCHAWHEYFVVCKVCRDLGIKTVELQHGVTGDMDAAYNLCDDSVRTDYLPKYIFTFGEYWNGKINFYHNDVTLIKVGYPFLEAIAHKTQKDKNTVAKILLVSQGTIGPQMCKIARELASLASKDGYEVFLRLHPGEFPVYKNLYPGIEDESNLTVINNDKYSIFDCMEMCGHIVGAYSLAMFEAVRLGKFVYVMEGPGREYMDCLIQIDLAKKYETVSQLWNLIKRNSDRNNSNMPKADLEYFLMPGAEQNIVRELNRLLV